MPAKPPVEKERLDRLLVNQGLVGSREAAVRTILAGGVLVANPIPADAEIPRAEIDPIIERALADMAADGVTGKDTTPYLLGRIVEITGGRSLAANVALVKNNARVAAEIAAAYAAGAASGR